MDNSISSDQEPSATALSYVAVSCVASMVGGLLLAIAAYHSFERGLLVWAVACISSGIILSSLEPLTVRRGIKVAMLSALVMMITVVGYYVVRWLGMRVMHIEAVAIAESLPVFAPLNLMEFPTDELSHQAPRSYVMMRCC
jgi:hypothetical protein